MGFLTALFADRTVQIIAALLLVSIVTYYLLQNHDHLQHDSSRLARLNGDLTHPANTSSTQNRQQHIPTTEVTTPVSVNYHFTRKCNKVCGFCFHTEKTSHVATEEEMKRGLGLLKEAGMRKINFAGGEPFLYPKQLAMLCEYCKVDLGLESVSIISNGTKITEKWLQKNGQNIDVLGVSCDSFDEATNIKIGRGTGENVTQFFRIRGWCRDLGIRFKLNTVVCSFNWQEEMAATVEELDPFRWKCFQVLEVKDENDASVTDTELDNCKRNAKEFAISDEQFAAFCDSHKHLLCFVPEANQLMASSYLIVDEYLCFLDKGDGKEKQSSCILDVGVSKALEEVYWDEKAFSTKFMTGPKS